jgi:DNA ligase-1
MVLDGELLSDSEGSTNEVYAETSSKARNKDKNKTGLIYNVFEILPLDEFQNGKSKFNTVDRKELLHDLLNREDLNFVKEVEMLYCGNDISQIDYWTRHALDNQWEGCMLSLNKPYECKRSSFWMKWKPTITVDLNIIGFEEGTGRNQGRLGAIICEGVDNERNIRVNVGSGLSDSNRDEYWNARNDLFGRVVEVQADAVTQNQDGTYSLRFPRFVRFRGFEPGEKL